MTVFSSQVNREPDDGPGESDGDTGRLREQTKRAGLTIQDIAALLGVQPGVVEGWVTEGRTPRLQHRIALAVLLGVHHDDLWPPTGSRRARAPQPARPSGAVTVHGNHGEMPSTQALALLAGAARRIDICVGAEAFAATPFLRTVLAGRARAMVRVRAVVCDPDGFRLVARDAGPADLPGHDRIVTRYLALARVSNVAVRLHDGVGATPLFCVDDTILAQARIVSASRATAHDVVLDRIRDDASFIECERGFTRTWTAALAVRSLVADDGP